MNAQMSLAIAPPCKEKGCVAPTVGHSITGKGHVCKAHNVAEWGRALARNPDPYYRRMGARLLDEVSS